MVFDALTTYLAEKVPPLRRLLPNQTYSMWKVPSDGLYKTSLPKNPNTVELRRLSKEPIVRKAISIIQDSLSRQPYTIDVIGGRGKFIKQIATIQNIIEHPNLVDSRESFTKRLLDDAVVVDAMCAEVADSTDPTHPVYLYPVDGSTIQFVVPYDYVDENAARYMQRQEDGMHYFSAKDIAYLQRSYFTYQPFGLSPVMQAYRYIQFYLDSLERSNAKATNGIADFLINLGEDVTEEQRQAFVEYMAKEIQGTGDVPVFAGTKVDTKQLTMAGVDGLYLQWQEKLTQIIGVAFGLPPERLGIVMPNDRSTGIDQENMMVQEVIRPYGAMMETLINNYIIQRMGYGGMLKFRFLYEESEQQKSTKSTRLVNEYYRSTITENEFRHMMGYPLSTSEYADMTLVEKTAKINVDLGIAGGFHGNGDVMDTSESPNREDEYDT